MWSGDFLCRWQNNTESSLSPLVSTNSGVIVDNYTIMYQLYSVLEHVFWFLSPALVGFSVSSFPVLSVTVLLPLDIIRLSVHGGDFFIDVA